MLFFCFYLSYRCTFIVTSLLLFTFISTLKIIVSIKGGYFVMNSLLASEDATVTKSPHFVRTNLIQRNIPLPTVDDKCSFTRARNALVSLIRSIESLESNASLVLSSTRVVVKIGAFTGTDSGTSFQSIAVR